MTTRSRVAGTAYQTYTLGAGAVIVPGAGSQTLTWALPLTMANGSALGVPNAQNIHYDTVSRMGTGVDYANTFPVNSTSATTKVVTGLQVGTTYYYALSFSIGGVRSAYSVEMTGVAA